MTLNFHEARALAQSAIEEIGISSSIELLIMEGCEVETEDGWIFFYNSRQFIDTGNPMTRLAGNGPIYVTRQGTMHRLPSAVPWEIAVAEL